MTFVETLWASGNDAAAQMASDPFVDLGSASHTFLMEQVRHYCFIEACPKRLVLGKRVPESRKYSEFKRL